MTSITKAEFIKLAERLWDEAVAANTPAPAPEQPKPDDKVIYSFELPNSPNNGFEATMEILTLPINAIDMSKVPVGSVLLLPDGGKRPVTSVGPAYNNSKAMIKFTGGAVVGRPGTVKVLAAEGVTAPKPEGGAEAITTPAPQGKGRILLNIGLGSGGDSVLPGKDGTDYRLPTRRDWEGAAAHGFKSARLGFLWERMTGGGAPGRGQINGYFVDRVLKSLEIGREVGMDVSAFDMHNYAGYSTTNTSKDRKKIGTSAVPVEALGNDWAAFLTELMKNDVARTIITGIDVMNEPVGIKWDVWKQALQHAVTKIASVVPDLPIHLEGINYSSTIDWVKNNPTMHEIVHPKGKDFLIPHGHLYLDERSSGFWDTAKDKADDFKPDDGIKSIQSFYNWCEKHGYKRRVIGETWVPGGFPRSQRNLDNLLGWCIDHGVDVYLWYWSEGANGSTQDMQSQKNRSTLDIVLKHLKVSS